MIRRPHGIQAALLVLATAFAPASRAQSLEVINADRLPPEFAAQEKACMTPVRDPEAVSILLLIASPERYEGKPVMVFGFYHQTVHPFHSASVLYLHREDYEHELTLNSLWIERPEGTELNDGYAVVTGIFSTKVNGDLGGWDAGICNVTELREWRPGMYGPSERP